jgi:NADPH:quinone reductase-like Zn-dependent oxidoreductase
MIAHGIYPLVQKPDLVPCSDGAGEVVAVGSGVSLWKVGDRVMGTFVQGWEHGPIVASAHQTALGGSLDGVLTQYVSLPERGLVRVPEHLSYEEASALPCAAVTVWNALFELAPRHQPGASVLLQGSGGVSIAALQFARVAGLRVIATTSKPSKIERLRELGADVVIDTQATPDWAAETLAATAGLGVDHVIDVGGAQTLERSLAAVKYNGTVSMIGVLTGIAPLNPFDILARSVRLQGLLVGSRATFEAMNRAITAHTLRPVIDRVFPFQDASAALAHLGSGAHIGKIVISVS